MKMKNINIIIAFSVLLVFCCPAFGEDDFDFNEESADQGESREAMPLSGSVKMTTAAQMDEPYRWIEAGPTLYGIFDYYSRIGQFYFEGNVRYNAAYRIEKDDEAVIRKFEFEPTLRELYWKRAFGPVSMSAGNQLVIWGAGDFLSVVDRIPVTDFARSFFADPKDVKQGQNLLSLNAFFGSNRIDLLFVPYPRFDLVTDGEHPYSITPGYDLKDKESKRGPEGAGRWSYDFDKASLSLLAGYVNNRFPIIDSEVISLTQIRLQKVYEPYFYGSAYSTIAVDPVLIKLEAVFDYDRPMQTFSGKLPIGATPINLASGMAGLDVNAGDFGTFIGEFSGEIPLEKDDEIEPNREVFVGAVGWSNAILNDTLNFNAVVTFPESVKNNIARFEAGYDLLDNLNLLAKYTVFSIHDQKETYEQINNYDRFDIQVEFSF